MEQKRILLPLAGKIQHGKQEQSQKGRKIIELGYFIAKAENLHAITYGRISEYGKELLEYYRTLSRQEKNSLQSEFEDVLYVPSQYGGYSCI